MVPDLARFAGLPEVRSMVLGDASGLFIDAFDEPDGESVAAIMGFLTSAFGEAGETLGLGELRRVSLVGGNEACVVTVRPGAVITVYVDPAKPMAAVERTIDGLLQQ